MGNAVTAAEITRHLQAYAEAGIGGVEITPIYGVRGQERQFLRMLSPGWIKMIRHTVAEGRRLGVGVDMTLGSGWPYGGAHVTTEDAPRQTELRRIDLPRGQSTHTFEGRNIEAARIVGADAAPPQLRSQSLTCDVPSEGATLHVLLSGPTRQQVKRAAPGGEGNVMCPYRRESFDHFIAPFSQFLAPGTDCPRGIFYDSFEVFAADFATGLVARFRELKGYDIADHLPSLAGEGDAGTVGRVRHDYREVLADCLLHDGIRPWVDWCRRNGMLARYQAHGAPGNLIDLYAQADIPETEVFGTNHFPWLEIGPHPQVVAPEYPLVNKLASSAAHLTGKPLTSSETYTWLRDHYNSTLSQMKAEADQLFFTGINHIFFHGSTYSPKEAGFPGWQFYAATHCDIGDAIWHDLPQLNHYIAFCQQLLQQSRIVGELLFYFPFHDIISLPAERLFMQLSVHHLPEWIAQMPWGRSALRLWKDSYAFDFISDSLLDQSGADEGIKTPGGRRYRAIVLPPVQFIPLQTLEKLVQLARSGVPVIVIGELPQSEPGLSGAAEIPQFAALRSELRKLARPVAGADALPSALRELGILPCPATPIEGLRGMRLRREDQDVHFLANVSAHPLDTWVDLQLAPDRRWALIDPTLRRETGAAQTSGGRIYIQLHPGESIWVMPQSATIAPWHYLRPTGEAINLNVTGQLDPMEGGPSLPPAAPISRCTSWTKISSAWRDFSGTARYSLKFDFTGKTDGGWMLRFPAVGESVRVSLNGRPLCPLWCLPFEIEVTGLLRNGENELICEVTNLSANRVAALDRQGVAWRNFHEINFVNLHYQPFDASGWPARPSGLLANPQLVAMERFSPRG